MLIADRLTQVFSDPEGASCFPLAGVQPDVPSPPGDLSTSFEFLLSLDGPGWGQFFVEHAFSSWEIRRLDDLVALWLNHQDYRRLREMAMASRLHPTTDDVDKLLSQWLFPADVERLGHLVVGMRFDNPQYPICYALGSASRAVRSAIEFAGFPRGFSDSGITQMQSELRDNAEEDAILAAKGF